MSKKLLYLVVALLVVACSSNKKKEEPVLEERKNDEIQREYIVRDASSNSRPGWIEDAEVWAKQNQSDADKMRYFSFETEPKVSRQASCDIAKANVKVDIAGEITTFIQKTLATTQEGNASVDLNSPSLKPLKEYMDNSLSEKVQSLVHGAQIVKTYWEYREYQKSKGAREDFKSYTCAVLVRMDSDRLKKAVDEASQFVVNKAENPEMKEKIKKQLEDAAVNFEKARRGEI